MILGGGNPATASTEIIDLSVSSPQWRYAATMSQPRIEMNATILPNGKVLAMGGSTRDEDAATASLNADLYDPNTNSFSSAGVNAYPRLYHSGSLLLPDATVMLVGGNPTRGRYEEHIEIYSPAYLFNGDGSPATRPIISSVSSSAFGYNATFQVETPDAANITSVVLVRPGAQTHSIDMDQRLVGLAYTTGTGVLDVTAPPNGNIAPPGYYMLFVLNSAGVPSLGKFVRLSTTDPNQRPTATITGPSANVAVQPGESVFFSGTGSDPDGTVNAYSWTFPGGNPGSSSIATPGNVSYSTPGTYVASFTVTDNGGSASPPATRTITVPDFSVSSATASRSVLPGGGAPYTATVTAGTGFSGTVAFSVTGLPPGATASFTPASVNSSGSTTLIVSTIASTPPGSYPLTITGTSGPLAHSVNVTLVVNADADFTIAVAAPSLTVNKGDTASYTVTIASGQGFSGTVDLSVTGLPKFASPTFTPTSIVNSGTSVLTVSTKKNVRAGTYNLTITGTSNGVVHSTNASFNVQ
jgi:PKD repeat protein